MYNPFRDPPAPGSGGKLPTEYVDALRRTPMGLATLDFVRGLEQARPLQVEITTEPLAEGHGYTDVTPKGLFTKISIANDDPADRMHGWNAMEIINIVGVHERGHYVVTPEGSVTDQCSCSYGPCHVSVIASELAARFQYSLIQPASPKVGWLDNYRRYFATAIRLQGDAEYAELCQGYAQAPVSSRARERAARAMRKYEERHAPEAPSDTTPGSALALTAYTEALRDLEVAASRFAADGAYDDLAPYQQVLARMDDYRDDTTFALIP